MIYKKSETYALFNKTMEHQWTQELNEGAIWSWNQTEIFYKNILLHHPRQPLCHQPLACSQLSSVSVLQPEA